jgi:hypothetical protein
MALAPNSTVAAGTRKVHPWSIAARPHLYALWRYSQTARVCHLIMVIIEALIPDRMKIKKLEISDLRPAGTARFRMMQPEILGRIGPRQWRLPFCRFRPPSLIVSEIT